MTPTLFVVVAVVTAFLVSLMLAAGLAWWIQRTDPDRWERVR